MRPSDKTAPDIRSEIRRDPLDGRGVIVAPGRSARPNDFRAGGPGFGRKACPFCEGREGETPPEIEAVRPGGSASDGPGWKVRVIPNKFPALTPSGRMPPAGRFYPETADEGDGVHEVVVDSPDHEREWADMTPALVRNILSVFRSRLRALESRPGVRYVQIFKNRGAEAGASLRHPHTQILALPIVPPHIRSEMAALEKRYRVEGRCYFCRLLEQEAAGPRRVGLDPHFAALAPFASRFPYEIHVLPRRHAPRFAETTDEELSALASMMVSLFRRLRRAAGDPPFHLVLRQAPRPGRSSTGGNEAFAHWRFEILPILGRVAGFEWGTGFFINPVFPEEAADDLRRGTPGKIRRKADS